MPINNIIENYHEKSADENAQSLMVSVCPMTWTEKDAASTVHMKINLIHGAGAALLAIFLKNCLTV